MEFVMCEIENTTSSIDIIFPMIGVVVGGFIAFFSSYIINRRNNKEKYKTTIQIKSENVIDEILKLSSYAREFFIYIEHQSSGIENKPFNYEKIWNGKDRGIDINIF
jgi:predicted histidine transporter YuiF (NhaC family)